MTTGGKFTRYILIEYKRTAFAFVYAAAALVMMAAVVSCLIFGSAYVLQRSGLSEPVNVAMVVKDDDSGMDMAVSLISSMDTVSRFCRLEAMGESEAMKLMEEGSLDGVIIFPEHFYTDINTGINTPARVILPEGSPIGSGVLKEFLQDGVSVIDTAEAGIYAVTDAAYTYEMKLTTTQMENLLTRLYAMEAISRGRHFESLVMSPTGEQPIADYYCAVALTSILLMMGFYFGYLYSDDAGGAILRKLKVYGIGAFKTGAARILVMTSMLLFFGYMIDEALYIVMGRIGQDTGRLYAADAPYMAVMCFSMAAFFHFIYSLSDDIHANKIMMLLAELMLLIFGGAILPIVYLPLWVQTICRMLPGHLWIGYTADTVNALTSPLSAAAVAAYGALFFAAGTFLQWKRL